MKKKEKSNFIFSPEYAYGRMGCPPRYFSFNKFKNIDVDWLNISNF
jgi:hypothetical protein